MSAGRLVLLFLILYCPARGMVDTLRDTSEINDALIFDYENCTSELQGEDCRRFNGGKVINLGVGTVSVGAQRRALFSWPGWDGSVPDSAFFEVYISSENDTQDRKLFVYPLTTAFIEGTESTYGIGNYPDPDSGVTWNHAWLDDGDSDSLNWSSAGSDFTTAIACTTVVTQAGQYFRFDNFERIIQYWDSTGNDYGVVLVNENAFPGNSTAKVIKSSEAGAPWGPLLILYGPSAESISYRRRQVESESKGR
ncbi:MAG: hypothetical protein P1R58_05180 [bacterium]|nr:hypothetical protein [bacterium]